MVIILTLFLSYIIGILSWTFILLFNYDIQTYGDLLKELKDTPAFIPIINILAFIGCSVVCIFIFTIYVLYKFLLIEKLWNKIKDKKIKPWTK